MYVYKVKGSDQSWAGFEISRVQDTARAVNSAQQKKRRKYSVRLKTVSWQKKIKIFIMLVLTTKVF